VINLGEKPGIDTQNKIERDIDGCKVRLFFPLQPNENTKKRVLDHLMLSFDRKVQGAWSQT
jgi:hypothetical protein